MRLLVNACLVGVGLVLMFSCVDKLELQLSLSSNVVTVDASLNNLPEQQRVILKYSESTKTSSYDTPITKAKVEVTVNGTEKYVLTENEPGYYYLPTTFKVQTGNTYQLRFTLSTGQVYESEVETMSTVPTIKKVYDAFDEKLFESVVGLNTLTYSPGNVVYVDTEDPAGVRNFYQWSWTLWERQSVCASCERGNFYLVSGNQRNVCVSNNRLPSGTVYDYYCEGQCWQIFYNTDLNVMADTYSDGKQIIGRPVAKIPFYSRNGALLEIRQKSLSVGAFRYLKLLADQSQNTGTLADTPPAPIIGNIKNLSNPQEPVVGYFQATGVASVRYWLSRENAQQYNGKALGLLSGRDINPEPASLDLTRPPFAPCTPGVNRTPTQPIGWR